MADNKRKRIDKRTGAKQMFKMKIEFAKSVICPKGVFDLHLNVKTLTEEYNKIITLDEIELFNKSMLDYAFERARHEFGVFIEKHEKLIKNIE